MLMVTETAAEETGSEQTKTMAISNAERRMVSIPVVPLLEVARIDGRWQRELDLLVRAPNAVVVGLALRAAGSRHRGAVASG
jgi:hypothetical protein